MGCLFSKCLKRKENDDARRMTAVAPNQLDETLLEQQEEVDEFYCIPNEHHVDETIARLDELQKLDEKSIATMNETIGDLTTLLHKYKPNSKTSLQAEKLGSSYLPPTLLTDVLRSGSQVNSPPSSQLLSSTQTSRPGSQLRSENKKSSTKSTTLPVIPEKQKPHLKIEVQSAKFFHEVLLEKHDLKNPYVLIKIYLKPYVKMDSSIPSTSSQINPLRGEEGQKKILLKYGAQSQKSLILYAPGPKK